MLDPRGEVEAVTAQSNRFTDHRRHLRATNEIFVDVWCRRRRRRRRGGRKERGVAVESL